MKCRLVKLVLFLLLGAIVNVAVAWGSAILINPWRTWRSPQLESVRYVRSDMFWLAQCDAGTGFATFISVFARIPPNADHSHNPERGADPATFIPYSSGMITPTPGFENGDHSQEYRVGVARGWPMLSMWHLDSHIVDQGEKRTSGGIKCPLPEWETIIPGHTPIHERMPRVLPLLMLWPGFAINTVFYAGILWVLFAAPFALRRWRRIRRGLCPACAYPVGDSAVCTECGKGLIKQKAELT